MSLEATGIKPLPGGGKRKSFRRVGMQSIEGGPYPKSESALLAPEKKPAC